MNGTNEKQRNIQDCFSPGGGCCKGSDQSGAPAPRSALAWTVRCLRVDVPPWRIKKLHFWNSIRPIWYIPFGNILLKKSFKLCAYIIRSEEPPTFPVLMPLSELILIFENLKSGCLRGVFSQELLRGSSPFRSWKKCNFQTQLVAYSLNPKRAGIRPPPSTFFVISLPVVIF